MFIIKVYHQTSNTKCTKSKNWNVSHLNSQFSLPNPWTSLTINRTSPFVFLVIHTMFPSWFSSYATMFPSWFSSYATMFPSWFSSYATMFPSWFSSYATMFPSWFSSYALISVIKVSLKFVPKDPINTLRPRQNGCQFRDEIFKCIFSN